MRAEEKNLSSNRVTVVACAVAVHCHSWVAATAIGWSLPLLLGRVAAIGLGHVVATV